MVTMATSAALVALLVLACWFDVRERRIPNALTVVGAGLGLALRVPLGSGAVIDGAAGVGVAVLVALPPFAFGFLGGGDVKLWGAAGAFLGLERLFGAALLVALAGGVLALAEATRQRVLRRAMANTWGFAKDWMLFGRAGSAVTLRRPGTLSVPYGIAIAAGCLVWWFFGGAVT